MMFLLAVSDKVNVEPFFYVGLVFDCYVPISHDIVCTADLDY